MLFIPDLSSVSLAHLNQKRNRNVEHTARIPRAFGGVEIDALARKIRILSLSRCIHELERLERSKHQY